MDGGSENIEWLEMEGHKPMGLLKKIGGGVKISSGWN